MLKVDQMEVLMARLFVLLVCLLGVIACAQEEAVAPPAGSAAAPPISTAAGIQQGTVTGLRTAAGYTYVAVQTADGVIQLAAPETPLEVGQVVSFPAGHVMTDFYSRTFDETFPSISFVGWVGVPPEAQSPAPSAGMGAGAAAGGLPPGHPTPEVAQVGRSEPLHPAEGGLSVAAVWAQRAQLAGQQVRVRGEVVKVNERIMGTNWVHLQDGTGSASTGDHDLLLTTQNVPTVGTVVVAEGTIAVDRDFGAGYSYAVLIDEGRIVSTP